MGGRKPHASGHLQSKTIWLSYLTAGESLVHHPCAYSVAAPLVMDDRILPLILVYAYDGTDTPPWSVTLH